MRSCGRVPRWMLAEALQAEVDAYIAAFAAERDENGRRLVVRNGCHQSWEGLTSAGAVEGTAPLAARSSSPWPTGTASRPSRGRTCSATARAAACAPGARGRGRALGFWGALRELHKAAMGDYVTTIWGRDEQA